MHMILDMTAIFLHSLGILPELCQSENPFKYK